MNRNFRFAAYLLFTFVIPIARADVTFHGYGQTVVGTTFSNNDRVFPLQSTSSQYSADPNFQQNSNFALQAAAPLSDSISAVAQVLALGQEDFKPKFQWAYLTYHFNDTFALKAGRLQFPFYQYSDYFYVGEAYPWVVPPEAVYITETTHYDGINASAQQSIGDWYLYWQVIFGSTDTQAPSSGTSMLTISDHNMIGITLDSSYNDWLSLRAGYFLSKLSITGDGSANDPLNQVNIIVDSLKQSGLDTAARDLEAKDDLIQYYTVGFQITRWNWMILGEFAGLNLISPSFATNTESEYLTVGHRWGRFTPLLTFGHRNQWMPAGKILQSIPAGTPLYVNGTPINGIPVADLITTFADNPLLRAKDYYYGIGLRYDLTSNVALKIDFTHYDSHYTTSDYPTLIQAPGTPPVTNPQDANRLLAAVTFSF